MQLLGEPAGALMVLGKALEVVVECVEARRGEDADLPHAAAEPLAQPVQGGKPRAGGRDERSRRRPQAFAEADAHRVGARPVVGEPGAGRDMRVPQARAVEVDREAGGAGRLRHRLHLGKRPHRSAAAVVRVLDGDGALPRVVRIVRSPQPTFERTDVEEPARSVERKELRAPQRGGGRSLVVEDVRAALADHLVAGAAEDAERNLVRHGAGRDEDRALLAEQLRDAFL